MARTLGWDLLSASLKKTRPAGAAAADARDLSGPRRGPGGARRLRGRRSTPRPQSGRLVFDIFAALAQFQRRACPRTHRGRALGRARAALSRAGVYHPIAVAPLGTSLGPRIDVRARGAGGRLDHRRDRCVTSRRSKCTVRSLTDTHKRCRDGIVDPRLRRSNDALAKLDQV